MIISDRMNEQKMESVVQMIRMAGTILSNSRCNIQASSSNSSDSLLSVMLNQRGGVFLSKNNR